MNTSQNIAEQPSLGSIVGRLSALLEHSVPLGDVAALRRMQPSNPACSAFWRLMALDIVALPSGPSRDDGERRWACILQLMASTVGLHSPAMPLGRALAMSDMAETRVIRLLRASGPALEDAVRITGHHLAQKAVPANFADVAALVLSDGRNDEESVRRRIARTFYSQQAKEA
jgi:CRISPR type I-E-associated protein CasB/Cse2